MLSKLSHEVKAALLLSALHCIVRDSKKLACLNFLCQKYRPYSALGSQDSTFCFSLLLPKSFCHQSRQAHINYLVREEPMSLPGRHLKTTEKSWLLSAVISMKLILTSRNQARKNKCISPWWGKELRKWGLGISPPTGIDQSCDRQGVLFSSRWARYRIHAIHLSSDGWEPWL